jgi:hypothetical protein
MRFLVPSSADAPVSRPTILKFSLATHERGPQAEGDLFRTINHLVSFGLRPNNYTVLVLSVGCVLGRCIDESPTIPD